MDKTTKRSLSLIRKKINKIDAQIIGLLKKRSFIIPKVKMLKDKNLNYKVAFKREADMAYKIQKSDFGLYDKTFMQKIFRELISATLNIECDLAIQIYQTNNSTDSWEIVKDHFGIKTKLIYIDNFIQLFDNLINKKIDVAIVPFFNFEISWWTYLANEKYKVIKINLVLPLIGSFNTINKTQWVCLSLNSDDNLMDQEFYLINDNFDLNLLNKFHINYQIFTGGDTKYDLICIDNKNNSLLKNAISTNNIIQDCILHVGSNCIFYH